jgi:hypothetical protein
MSTISGLQAPNPYAQQPAPPRSGTSSAGITTPVGKLPERAVLDRVSFTPDWMQDGQVPPLPVTNGVYNSGGELKRLPEPASPVRGTPSEKGQASY